MRVMPIPADNEAPRFNVSTHSFNIHLSKGKWSVHIDSRAGYGRFFGPHQHEGTIWTCGKVVSQADCYLPSPVQQALTEGGFDCAAVTLV